ncbi:ATP-binding protein [Brevibacterium sp. 50QC2O2]|uniref:sensor histidine kinase n=1 Tax=Brevibacterium TaxID=1696 RepID=UPI00211BF2B3|nr:MULTISPECIES: ATP-binding protein [unclassified Brevibacterium]MCQ9384288.1 ATP-binding protein [Brevibacterium sp. 68QC2CO]MCQ9388907.1 ATP-binding protein [Brevibacterium sp. 50QC2O2]
MGVVRRRAEARRPASVGFRLTAGVTVIVALALLAVGVVLYIAQSAALQTRIDRSMTQEITEFRDLAASGIDPDTGEHFSSVDRMLSVFLARNEPESAETLFAFKTDGTVIYQGIDDGVLRQKEEFRSRVTAIQDAGGLTEVRIGGSLYRMSVLPVSQPGQAGAFVVVHNVTTSRGELTEFMRTYAIVAVFTVIVVGFLSGYLSRRLLEPVASLRATAQSISSGALDKRLEVTGHDDLAELGNTFNAMLDRLEQAFETQRKFLDDAGHELRTPLTILRGHLEVLDVADVDDVEQTRELLLDEIMRMSRLVDDLLVLAKARRHDFVRAEPVDPAVLLPEVVAKASGLAPRHWHLEPPPRTVITADPQRLTQALLQLADNAVRHTEPGSTISFGAQVHAQDGTVDLWVADDGPGVPEEIRAEIFHRFSRGDTNELGAGLGLAIVQAIAAAHGGRASLDPPDPARSGAVFRLSLPIDPTPSSD